MPPMYLVCSVPEAVRWGDQRNQKTQKKTNKNIKKQKSGPYSTHRAGFVVAACLLLLCMCVCVFCYERLFCVCVCVRVWGGGGRVVGWFLGLFYWFYIFAILLYTGSHLINICVCIYIYIYICVHPHIVMLHALLVNLLSLNLVCYSLITPSPHMYAYLW